MESIIAKLDVLMICCADVAMQAYAGFLSAGAKAKHPAVFRANTV